ncbi:hypothetical protein [Streptomyces misionensis]|uniref:hypothetical protein n=1 Tax=Streptomyces misionensis TaxID=67331 RepID=UPI0036B24066
MTATSSSIHSSTRSIAYSCGDQVGRQLCGQGRAQRVKVDVAGTVRDQVVGASDHDGGTAFAVGGDGGLGLAGFDPQAARLDLADVTADELQCAAGPPPDFVAGAVHPASTNAAPGRETPLGTPVEPEV